MQSVCILYNLVPECHVCNFEMKGFKAKILALCQRTNSTVTSMKYLRLLFSAVFSFPNVNFDNPLLKIIGIVLDI